MLLSHIYSQIAKHITSRKDALPSYSERAFDASHDADDEKGHMKAAKAHREAAEKSAKKGDTHTAELHARMAKMHAEKSEAGDVKDPEEENEAEED